jgi:hypothetical protein
VTDRSLSVADGPAFVSLMKRYVVDYTNSHDQAQSATIMVPDYRLRMGEHIVSGRDGAYAQATRRQLDQFPGLGLTVHEICTSGERLAMRFSEHGMSLRHEGARAAWGGIGLYHWNGSQLTANNVEQDYFSRALQLASKVAQPVEPPAIAPWNTDAEAPDERAVRIVGDWLETGRLASTAGVICDDGWTGAAVCKIVEQSSITINDLFSCGSCVAFHVAQHGALTADFAKNSSQAGRSVTLFLAGIVHVGEGKIERGRIIRNRLDLSRTLDRNP